ncbi:helix-turn-helix domain-containing protein [Patescibacteria group bacterium]
MRELREFLTVKEASKLLKKHPGTIRQWIKDKKIPAKKLGGKYGIYLIRNDDILELMIKKLGNKKEGR